MHHLGTIVGEPNTDVLNELPLPMLLRWRDYIQMQSGSEPKGVSPATMLEIFRKQYGPSNG